ncbi:uncharacterized protein LOC125550394 [Triticum urartu]|uniref:uncharacterized protein LOC125550394 n=1 Tax=Triticum urartu TaxID=4572 RepID=UPI002043F978|nr:uncharacterized protein LOC125550394 [Triticum urartu]
MAFLHKTPPQTPDTTRTPRLLQSTHPAAPTRAHRRRSSPAQLRRAAPLLSRTSSSAAGDAYATAPSCLAQLPWPPCLPPKSPLFHPQSCFFFLPLRLLLARCGDTSSSLPPTPEEARGKQQCLALRLRHLGCAWAYASVAASAVRQSAKEEEGDSVRRQGVLGMLLESPLFRPLLTSLIKKQNNMTQSKQGPALEMKKQGALYFFLLTDSSTSRGPPATAHE